MLIELLILSALLINGVFTGRLIGLKDWGLVVMAPPLGVITHTIVTTLAIVLSLSTNPLYTLAISTLLPAMMWLFFYIRGKDVSINLLPMAAYLLILPVLIYLIWRLGIVNWHVDTFFYLESSTLIANDKYEFARTLAVTKRMFTVPIIHSLAQIGDALYLRALTPLLGVSLMAIFVYGLQKGFSGLVSRKVLIGTIAMGLLLLMTNNRFVFHLFYINGHLIFAVFSLVIAVASWLLIRAKSADESTIRALINLQAISVPALILTRPEGIIFAPLLLLPILLTSSIRERFRNRLLVSLGVSLTICYGYIVFVHERFDVSAPISASGPLVLGILFTILGLTPFLKLTTRLISVKTGLWVTELLLWLLLAVVVFNKPSIFIESVRASIINFFSFNSNWGASIIILAVIALVPILFTNFKQKIYLRFLITTFVPVAFILAYLRDSAYRVGDGDSLNRMLIQIVPIVVFFICVSVLIGKARFRLVKANNG